MTSSVPSEPRAAPRPLPWLAVLALAAAGAIGAAQLAFLCDDAFIHFRYAANAHDGLGLVWNPPPFAPVEGAGFLWALVLAGLWSLTGAEPPVAANPFSIGCGVVQVLLLAAAALRLRLADGARAPALVGIVVVAAAVCNRTFLQWWTSGLDTALFNMWLVGWVLHACRGPERRGGAWLAWWSAAAAMAALTRPDGLPLVAATAGVAAWHVFVRRARLLPTLLGLAPLLLVAAQLLWRRSFYGEWLPNTYFAKVVAAWPEAGLRYFACFALENGAWLWPLAAVAWLVCEARRGARTVATSLLAHVPAAAAIAVVLFNAGYYLLKVGGDHFEYRVLAHLVPLGTLAVVAMVLRCGARPALAVGAAAALALAGAAGWVHLALTSDARAEGIKALTPQVPAIVRPVARWFDRQQTWLFFRYIGLRCNHHAARLETLRARFPERVTLGEAAGPFPTRAESAVGLPGWCLRDCALIDVYGLNDWVVARTPTRVAEQKPVAAIEAIVVRADGDGDGWLAREELRDALQGVTGARPDDGFGMFFVRLFWAIHAEPGSERVTLAQAVDIARTADAPRRMAHERLPPPGYVEAFEPNVDVDDAGRVTVRPRAVPMTAERIRAIEAEWRERVVRGQLPR